MKQVFSNHREVAHIWAQRNHPRGRTSDGNVYFEGSTIYSYGNHFPIATFIEEQARTIVLYNADSYSVSTSKHQSHVWHATHHFDWIRTTTDIIKTVVDNPLKGKEARAFFKKQVADETARRINSAAASMQKRRAAHLKAQDLNEARDFLTAHERLLAIYGLQMPKNVVDLFTKLTEDSAAVLEMHKLRIEKKNRAAERQRKAEKKRRLNAAYESAQRWTDGKETMQDLGNIRYVDTVWMRVIEDGRTVETSQGARFPAEHGLKAFEMIRRARTHKKEWHRNGQQIRLGHYNIDKIDCDGNVTAGCHYVEWAEIARVAGILLNNKAVA